MRTGAIAIEAKGLTKMFAGSPILNGINLAAVSGEAVALTGCNGVGKTTLLACLSSRLRPSSGRVCWFGQPMLNPCDRFLIGVLGHESYLYGHQTVRENLMFAARMYGVNRAANRVDDLLCANELWAYAHRPTSQLSRGTRQRVSILRALVHEPRILLLDEPNAGLDSSATGWLVDLLRRRLDTGCTVCFATHDRLLVEKLADRVLRLHAGILLAADSRLHAGTEGSGLQISILPDHRNCVPVLRNGQT